jgi:non-specific serine/threonine protein kinase
MVAGVLLPVLTADLVLLLEGEAGSAVERRLKEAAEAGVGRLLRVLGTGLLTAEVEPPLRWLREWARVFLTRLCQVGAVADVPPPTEAEVNAWLVAAPYFAGSDRLSAEVAVVWWQALAEEVEGAVLAHAEGLAGWLREENTGWHLVGRVTFHLAENKNDSARPFAFLATFTERLSETGQPQHLPLARAMQMYAKASDTMALNALLEPVRAAAARSELVAEWLQSRRLFQPLAMSPPEAYRLLRESAVLQECGIIVKLPNWWRSGRGTRPAVQVTIDAPKQSSLHAGALLSFQMRASLNGEVLTEEEWQRLLAADTGLVSLRGQWVEVDGAQLQQVLSHWERVENATGEGGIGFLDGMRLLAGFDPRAFAEVDESLPSVAAWSEVVAGKNLEELMVQMANPEALPPPNLRATLRPYQQKGYAWLVFMTRLGLGACLADDMGLGKTVQVIALLQRRRETGLNRKPALLVVPASLIGNWRAEVAKFAPELRLFAAHPSVVERAELNQVARNPSAMLNGVDAMLTTYAFLQRTPSWQEHDWGLVILDEAQAIKNPSAAATKAVKRLQAEARVALTGTPVENRPGDLWSLFDFLNPGLLGSPGMFAEAVKLCAKASTGYASLRKLVGPYILRRMKTDKSIIADLPDKIELKAWCGLTKRQTVIYAKLVEQLATMLKDEDLEPMRRKGLVLGFLMRFKQICNHPSQWSGDGTWLPEDSGKFLRLGEIMTMLMERRERALVFTQFQETCAPLARYLATVCGREGLVLHGGTAVGKRPKLVEAFQQAGGPPFMVVSVKAGGTGLNLTAASQVIHFDRWWNPAVENQATDRAFRIGQKRNVFVHKFVCQGTIEERIDQMLEEKTGLARELLRTDAGAENLLTEMSAEDLLRFVSLDVSQAMEIE